MKQSEWVDRAVKKLEPYMGEQSKEYAESLYETYVLEDFGLSHHDDPEGAVEEDMSYWN